MRENTPCAKIPSTTLQMNKNTKYNRLPQILTNFAIPAHFSAVPDWRNGLILALVSVAVGMDDQMMEGECAVPESETSKSNQLETSQVNRHQF